MFTVGRSRIRDPKDSTPLKNNKGTGSWRIEDYAGSAFLLSVRQEFLERGHRWEVSVTLRAHPFGCCRDCYSETAFLEPDRRCAT